MVFSLSRAVAAGALLASVASAGDHFIITQTRTLSLTRIDPLMNPGGIGPHAHVVMGASNFGPDSGTGEKLAQAKCTSTNLMADKSSYWTPQLYYNHGNGSYSAIISSTRIYYFLKPLNGTKPVVPFPKGFRMLAGGRSDSRPQNYPPRGELSYEQQQAMDPRINAIKWGCSAGAVQGQGNGGSLPGQRPYIPNDAPNGCGVVNAGIFYPSCSDGRLDSDDHFSHMAYPLDGPNGYNCPTSHSIKYPTIFLENFYFSDSDQPYRGADKDNWVLSNGDTLGLTMHADFINGWDQDVFERTLQQCNTPNAPGADLQACAPLADHLSVEAADNCRSEGLIADEEVGLVAPINALPGCNPIWPVEARQKPSCKMAQEVAAVEPVSRYEIPDFKLALPLARGGGKSKVVTAPEGANPNSMSYNSDYYGSSTSSSYAPTSTASGVTTTASASTTASYTDYENGGSATTSASQPGSIASSDPYEYGAGSATSVSVATTASTTSDATSYSASQPGGVQPTLSVSGSQPGAADPTQSKTNGVSSTTASATPSPVPQKQSVNPAQGGPNPAKPKVCRRKKAKRSPKSHARRHRERQNRIIH